MKRFIFIVVAFILPNIGNVAFAGEPKLLSMSKIETPKYNEFIVFEWCNSDGYKMLTTRVSRGVSTVQLFREAKQYKRTRNEFMPPQPIRCKP